MFTAATTLEDAVQYRGRNAKRYIESSTSKYDSRRSNRTGKARLPDPIPDPATKRDDAEEQGIFRCNDDAQRFVQADSGHEDSRTLGGTIVRPGQKIYLDDDYHRTWQ